MARPSESTAAPLRGHRCRQTREMRAEGSVGRNGVAARGGNLRVHDAPQRCGRPCRVQPVDHQHGGRAAPGAGCRNQRGARLQLGCASVGGLERPCQRARRDAVMRPPDARDQGAHAAPDQGADKQSRDEMEPAALSCLQRHTAADDRTRSLFDAFAQFFFGLPNYPALRKK